MKTIGDLLHDVDRAHSKWQQAILSDASMELVFKLHLEYITALQRVTLHYQSIANKE